MNFNPLPWHRLPSYLDFTSLILLALLIFMSPVARADGVQPMRSGSAKNSAQAEALAPETRLARCVEGATRPARAREGQALFVHVAAHYAEKKSAASLPPARCCVLDVNVSFPHRGSLGVMQAGVVRGNGAGILLPTVKTYVAKTQQSAAAVSESGRRAPFNQELRRA